MILFRPEHVQSILDGRKTQTRRLGKKRWNVGAVHQARLRMMDADSCFARLRIADVRRENLNDITEADADAEGYDSRNEYLAAFYRINHYSYGWSVPDVWVVEFELVAALLSKGRNEEVSDDAEIVKKALTGGMHAAYLQRPRALESLDRILAVVEAAKAIVDWCDKPVTPTSNTPLMFVAGIDALMPTLRESLSALSTNTKGETP